MRNGISSQPILPATVESVESVDMTNLMREPVKWVAVLFLAPCFGIDDDVLNPTPVPDCAAPSVALDRHSDVRKLDTKAIGKVGKGGSLRCLVVV
jgi:hypothetical protein